MAIGFRSATEAGTGAAGTTQVINVPSGVVNGDLLLLVCGTADGDTGSVSPNGTWTEIVDNLNTGGAAPSPPGISVFWRIASSEPASYTITDTESSGIAGQMLCFTGVDNTTPIDVTTTTATGDGANADPPSIDYLDAGAAIVIGAIWDSTTSVYSAQPTGYTSPDALGNVIGTGGGNGLSLVTGYDLTPAADPENPGAFTSSAEQWAAFTLALRPALAEGIVSVDSAYGDASDELDFDDTSVDINGLNFEATQSTFGAVHISDADTLAGSANEVEIDGAINTWSDSLINLNFANLSGAELSALHTLGPGARYIIVTNNSADEYSLPITLHRPKAIEMVLSANFAPGSTTQRLTGLTGTFAGGRIEEALNPSTTDTNVAANGNREDVWNIQLNTTAREVVYDFRVLYGPFVPDPITQTPQVTGSFGAPTRTASGSPSIASPTASGAATIFKRATSVVTAAAVVATGVVSLSGMTTSSGSPSIESPTASGVVSFIKDARGAGGGLANVTWFYSCEDLNGSDVFDGSDSFPAAFDNTTDFTAGGTWTTPATTSLGGSAALFKASGTIGAQLAFNGASYIDRDAAFSIGWGFYVPSGSWGGNKEQMWLLYGANNQAIQCRISGVGDSNTGTIDMRFREPTAGTTSLGSAGGTLSSDTWYYVVLRVDPINENISYEVYSATGTLIDSLVYTNDPAPFAYYPLAGDTIKIGDDGGDLTERYWDNIIISSDYSAPLQDFMTAAGYSATQGGGVTIPAITSSGSASIQEVLTSSGAPSITEPTASGVARFAHDASGSTSIDEITASGSVLYTHIASGTASIDGIVASGTGTLSGLLTASGTPILGEIVASGATKYIHRINAVEVQLYTGTHTSTGPNALLFDSTKTWVPDALIGYLVRNLTRGSEAVITDNAATSLTSYPLQGGADPYWYNGDSYEIVRLGPTLIAQLSTLSAATTDGTVLYTHNASGTPSLDAITSSGAITKTGLVTASGAPSLDVLTASGVARFAHDLTGAASIEAITASGSVSKTGLVTASGTPQTDATTASGAVTQLKTASGTPSITAITADGAVNRPRVWLNATQTLSGATEMTVTAWNAAGTSVTFTDPTGAPIGSLYLGVEHVASSNVGWIAVTVNSAEPIASGTPSIDVITASGAAGVSGFASASGSPVLDVITASGVASKTGVLAASGTPVIDVVTVSGIVNNFADAEAFPIIDVITASGVVTNTAAAKTASGTPTLAEITASGTALKDALTASGSPSVATITASGTVSLSGFATASGTPVLEAVTASGVVTQTHVVSGATTIEEITSSGVVSVSGLATAFGTPSLEAVTSTGAVKIIKTARSGDLLTFADDFNRAGPGLGANWVNPSQGFSALQLVSNHLECQNTSLHSASPVTTFGADHFAEIDITGIDGANRFWDVSLMLRGNNSPTTVLSTGYEVYLFGDWPPSTTIGAYWIKRVGGVDVDGGYYFDLAEASSIPDGATFRAEVVGNQLRAWLDDLLLFSEVINDPITGAGPFLIHLVPHPNDLTLSFDNFRAGNIAGAQVAPITPSGVADVVPPIGVGAATLTGPVSSGAVKIIKRARSGRVLTYVDTFNRPGPSLGADWADPGLDGDNYKIPIITESRRASQQFTDGSFFGATALDSSFPANQFAEVQLIDSFSDNYLGAVWVWLRATVGPGINSGYYAYLNIDEVTNEAIVEINRWDAPTTYVGLVSTDPIPLPNAFSDGTVFGAEIVGDRISTYIDTGTGRRYLLTTTDSTYATGTVGFGMESILPEGLAHIDEFRAGTVGAQIAPVESRSYGWVNYQFTLEAHRSIVPSESITAFFPAESIISVVPRTIEAIDREVEVISVVPAENNVTIMPDE